MYPNQFITVSSYGQYTKHYFAHDRRVSSRVGCGINYDGQTPADEPWTTDLPSGRNWYDRSVAMKLQLSRAFECTDMTQERLELTTEWGVKQLMDPKEEGEMFYYHQNHQGSPSFISTTSGFLTEHLLLLAYGEVFASNQNAASWQNPYSFTGKEQDMESGLHYFGARYYLAEIGMWLSTDPLADQFANVSPYAYAANNPAFFTDRWGLAANPPAWWSAIVNGFSKILNLDNQPEPAAQPDYVYNLPVVDVFGEKKTNSKSGFLSGFLNGFGGGFSSTMQFLASLGSAQGWKDVAESTLDLTMMGCAYCPQGMIMRDQVADMTIIYIQNIPNMSAYEMGYDLGFGTEKALEIAATRGVSTGSGIGIGSIRILSNSSLKGTTLFKTGKNFRIDLDVRNGLHYHRRGPGGIGRHRPWQVKPGDQGDFKKRF